MVFDNPKSSKVTRWFKRVCTDDFPEEMKHTPHEIGVFFNDAFFDTVYRKLNLEEGSDKYSFTGTKLDPAEKLLSPRVMMEKFFDATNEKVRNWWLAENYEDWIVLYDAFDYDMKTPLKAGDDMNQTGASKARSEKSSGSFACQLFSSVVSR